MIDQTPAPAASPQSEPQKHYSNQWKRKSSLTILFGATAVIFIALALVFVNSYVGGLTRGNLVQTTEAELIRSADYLQLSLRVSATVEHPAISGLGNQSDATALTPASGALTIDFLTSPQGLPAHVPAISEGLGLLQLNLVDLEGNTLWSTADEPAGLGERARGGFQAATGGTVSSQLLENLELGLADGATDTVDVVLAYLPVRATPEGGIIAVLEIYRNVSGNVLLQVNQIKSAVVWTTVAVMGGLILVFLSFMGTADITIYRSSRREMALVEAQLEERKRIGEELQQARDDALEASRAKSEFLASMSHEIRTPMNAIIGMADLLSETPLNHDQQEYVRVFRTAGETLLDIINDILDLSKVESGQLTLERVDFDLDELVENTAEFFAIRSHEKGFELNCHVKPNLPSTLIGDPVRLRQVVTNLLSNAVKFTAKGEVVLKVESDPESDDPGHLLFQVSDSGVGIPADKIDAIFESFTQADSSTTREYGGTGLGLAICSRLVEMMGGRIWVESEMGRGSTFFFTAQFGVQDNPDRRALSWDSLVGVKTLIVDDNATNRLILTETLGAWGAVTTAVDDGFQGIEALSQAKAVNAPFELLLVDRRMPGMDGFGVAESIKEDLGIADMTIMMLTSDNRSEVISQCEQLGISRYLIKPVKRSELLKAITNALAVQPASRLFCSSSFRAWAVRAMIALGSRPCSRSHWRIKRVAV